MKILSGKIVAEQILTKIKNKIAKENLKLTLAVILVGSDPASRLYVKIKERTARKLGVGFQKLEFSENINQKTIINRIKNLNVDKKINGIIVQLPLPKKFDSEKIISTISPQKDIDGLINPDIIPPTPSGILAILRYYKIDFYDKKVVIVGYGRLVGMPMAKLLAKIPEKPAVVICDSNTKNLAKITLQADILISAVGIPNLITADMIKPGAVVIDAGTSVTKIKNQKSKIKNFNIVGDIDFEGVKDKCSYITPPVGGVGPVTVAMLLKNLLEI